MALGGIAEAYSTPGQPLKTGIVSVADETCAILTFGGALAALTYARATGIGQKVDCSLLGGQILKLVEILAHDVLLIGRQRAKMLQTLAQHGTPLRRQRAPLLKALARKGTLLRRHRDPALTAARERGLRAVMTWAVGRLSESERSLLLGLAVWSAGFTTTLAQVAFGDSDAVADPFEATSDLIELLRARVRQLDDDKRPTRSPGRVGWARRRAIRGRAVQSNG